MLPYFDFTYLLFLAPALILAMWAQARVKSAFHSGQQVPARLSGAAAARHILDQSGLNDIEIEEIGGTLSDHYDPRGKVLRLSSAVYSGYNAAAVGIAAHESGHAIQDATSYAPLVIRNAAVPIANVGGKFSGILLVVGLILVFMQVWFGTAIFLIGIAGYSAVLFFQLINLPVEFDASRRAKVLVEQLGMVDQYGAAAVNNVLNAAAWTYVAGTLQTVMTLAYFLFRFAGARRG